MQINLKEIASISIWGVFYSPSFPLSYKKIPGMRFSKFSREVFIFPKDEDGPRNLEGEMIHIENQILVLRLKLSEEKKKKVGLSDLASQVTNIINCEARISFLLLMLKDIKSLIEIREYEASRGNITGSV